MEPGTVLEAGLELDSDPEPLLCAPRKLSGPPPDSKYPVDPMWLLELRGRKVIRPPVEPWLTLVVRRPTLELGSPKVTWPTLELVARPALDTRMPLVLWLRMEPWPILGLLEMTRGVTELAF